jgi:hypothetical protein
MGTGRQAARNMKAYLGIRDPDAIYRTPEEGSDGAIFGFQPEERQHVRVRAA